MLSNPMHPSIAALAKKLFAITENSPPKPTERDRNKLMALRNRIKSLGEEPGIELGSSDETDRQYLYVVSTQEANRQEAFYESNGNKWEPIPYAEMTDDEAKDAIRRCIRRKLRSGVAISDIHASLKDDVGITTCVALSISPPPVDGRLPETGRHGYQFQFMAHGPSGATIS